MIEGEVDKVEKMIIRCMDEVNLYEEVLNDMRKNNVEWKVKEAEKAEKAEKTDH